MINIIEELIDRYDVLNVNILTSSSEQNEIMEHALTWAFEGNIRYVKIPVTQEQSVFVIHTTMHNWRITVKRLERAYGISFGVTETYTILKDN